MLNNASILGYSSLRNEPPEKEYSPCLCQETVLEIPSESEHIKELLGVLVCTIQLIKTHVNKSTEIMNCLPLVYHVF